MVSLYRDTGCDINNLFLQYARYLASNSAFTFSQVSEREKWGCVSVMLLCRRTCHRFANTSSVNCWNNGFFEFFYYIPQDTFMRMRTDIFSACAPFGHDPLDRQGLPEKS